MPALNIHTKKRLLYLLCTLFSVFVVSAFSRKAGILKSASASYCDPGVAIALSIDRSQSMLEEGPDGRTKLEWAKEAAISVLDSLIASGSTSVFVTVNSFGGQGNDGTGVKPEKFNSTLEVPLTNNYERVKDAIKSIDFITNWTCLECGVRIANSQLTSSALPKFVIILSDGVPFGNWVGTRELQRPRTIEHVNLGRSAGIEYAVVGYEGSAGTDHEFLLAIAGDPSRYVFEPNPSEWERVYLNFLSRWCVTPPSEPAPGPITTPTPEVTRIRIPNLTLNGIGHSLDAFVSVLSGSVSFLNFQVLDEDIATVFPETDNSAAFQTTATSQSLGQTQYSASGKDTQGRLIGAVGYLTVLNPLPWCQAQGGDVYAGLSIDCPIPPSCKPSACSPYLIKSGLNPAPGIAVAGQNISSGNGQASEDPYNYQLTNSSYRGALYNYAYLVNKINSINTRFINGQINSAQDLISGQTVIGYYWNRSSGDAVIAEDINLSDRKVILFTDGNLYVKGKINFTKGKGFFLAVAKGDIIVDPSVADAGASGSVPDNIPELEGLYFTDGYFVSQSRGSYLDKQLHIRGSVVAQGFELDRGLPDNSSIPSELFEFAPDQLLRLPAALSKRQIFWKEVAP